MKTAPVRTWKQQQQRKALLLADPILRFISYTRSETCSKYCNVLFISSFPKISSSLQIPPLQLLLLCYFEKIDVFLLHFMSSYP